MTTEVIRQEEEAEEEQLVRYKATIAEFWALPESVLPVEYINGAIIMAPTPTVAHQAVLRNLSFALHEFVLRTKSGSIFFSPLDVVLPSGDVVQPDAFFLTNEETLRALASKRVQGAPSFLVEILSPGLSKHDTLTKRELYEQNGVREYWIVDLKTRTVAQLIRHNEHFELTELGEGDTLRGVVLEGFEMTVGALVGDR
ncbi:MAG TPA: Uma2 family endonuclease [Pyrinomonadaceae bacterium]|nr:Uma2 family endonuclease [Pyrinomonadaceae bacterium]